MAYANLAGQRSMALDGRRNAVYDRALEAVVTSDSVVLDLGAGVGILGLLALKHGAAQVYAVEPHAVGSLAAEIAAANGWGDRLTVIQGRIEEIELPERVDVIVSAMTGNVLFNEDLLPTVFHARDRFLKDDGVLIPAAAAIDIALVSAPKLVKRHLQAWGQPHMGIDMSPPRRYAANAIVFRDPSLREAEPLSATMEFYRLGLRTAAYEPLDATIEIEAAAAGACDGMAAWLRIQLGEEWLSTGPFDPKVHWSPAWIPFDPPMDVEPGDLVKVRLKRPPWGDWVWQVSNDTDVRQGSTRFARPLGGHRLAAAGGTPVATDRARAVAMVIDGMDGATPVERLVDQVAQFTGLFPTRGRAEDFVRQLVRVHGRSGTE